MALTHHSDIMCTLSLSLGSVVNRTLHGEAALYFFITFLVNSTAGQRWGLWRGRPDP